MRPARKVNPNSNSVAEDTHVQGWGAHVEQGAEQRVGRDNAVVEEDEFWDYDKQVDLEGGSKLFDICHLNCSTTT